MGSSNSSTQVSEPWAPAQGQLTDILGIGQSLYESGGMSADPYSGQRVAGFGDVTQQAQRGIVDMASQGSPLLSGMQSTLGNMMNGDYQSDYLQNVQQNALSSAIPAAASMFSGSGMTDSSTAMDYVGRAATEAVAPYEYQAAEAAQNRAMQAAGMAPTAYQASFLPSQMLSQVGAQQDALTQAQIDADMQRHYEQQGQDFTALQNYANLTSAIGGLGGQTSGSTRQGMGFGDVLGAVGTGLTLFSDRRLKESITPIGKTPGGNRLYSYSYKWSPTVHIGVMADEVPHAIAGEVNGYSVVDYGKVA